MRNCCWKYIILILLPAFNLIAQDYSWWNETHQWDGQSHWSSYMKVSPAFMGPNAFPIPFAEKMILKPEFDVRFSNHLNFGEIARDIYLCFALPLGEKASLKFSMNPIEYFEMDSVIRNDRVVRDEFPKSYASGDLLVEMNALIFKNKNKQFIFNLGLKTASGSQFRNARYTDSPAYYFDLSYHLEKSVTEDLSYDLGALLGLYVWQTYMVNNRQNDAILAAFTFNLSYKDFTLSNSLRGFKGYMGNGDFPLLYSSKISRNWNTYELYLQQQLSLHDFPYNSIQLGFKLYL